MDFGLWYPNIGKNVHKKSAIRQECTLCRREKQAKPSTQYFNDLESEKA